MEFYSLDEIRAAAQGRWVDILGHFGVRTDLLRPKHGPCPGCGGKDRFRFDDINGQGTFICSQGGGDRLAGDGLKLLGHCKDWDWKKVAQELGDFLRLNTRKGSPVPRNSGVAVEPRASLPAAPEIDREKVEEFTRGMPQLDIAWFQRRSPVPVSGCGPAAFLSHLYEEGERVCVFTSFHSQGDFLFWKGRGIFRLSRDRGVKAVPSELPTTGREGAWFLVQPVTGQWEINQKMGRDDKMAKYTRRSEVNVTAWRYFVLESDHLEHALWMKVVANLPIPIAAIYTSGGKSIHALVKFPVSSKAGWDSVRNALRQMVCPLGADPGALSAVRLSRLPGIMREGTVDKERNYIAYPRARKQELLYLNPSPDRTPIRMMLEARG